MIVVFASAPTKLTALSSVRLSLYSPAGTKTLSPSLALLMAAWMLVLTVMTFDRVEIGETARVRSGGISSAIPNASSSETEHAASKRYPQRVQVESLTERNMYLWQDLC